MMKWNQEKSCLEFISDINSTIKHGVDIRCWNCGKSNFSVNVSTLDVSCLCNECLEYSHFSFKGD